MSELTMDFKMCILFAHKKSGDAAELLLPRMKAHATLVMILIYHILIGPLSDPCQ